MDSPLRKPERVFRPIAEGYKHVQACMMCSATNLRNVQKVFYTAIKVCPLPQCCVALDGDVYYNLVCFLAPLQARVCPVQPLYNKSQAVCARLIWTVLLSSSLLTCFALNSFRDWNPSSCARWSACFASSTEIGTACCQTTNSTLSRSIRRYAMADATLFPVQFHRNFARNTWFTNALDRHPLFAPRV